jgi:chromosome transmission fidelity protein 18
VIHRIRSAITSDAIGGRSQSKPNLVLIDEIDGAANTTSETGLIKFLVGLDAKKAAGASAKASNKKDETINDEDDGDADEGADEAAPIKAGKKNPKGITLCRPIICVCNDLYQPITMPSSSST